MVDHKVLHKVTLMAQDKMITTWDTFAWYNRNFSIRFWRQYVPLFASIATSVVPIVDFQ